MHRYFPKDGTSPTGHTHGWQNTVFLFTSNETDAQLVAKVYTTNYGEYKRYWGGGSTEGHPQLEYFHEWPQTHELGPSRKQGGLQPVINWEQLTPEARETLNTYSFGRRAKVAFNDANWKPALEEAWSVGRQRS